MPATTIDVHELPARLSEVISLAASGVDIVITDGNVALAKLVPLQLGNERIPGLHPGAMQPTKDFDAPLPDDFWSSRKQTFLGTGSRPN